VSDEIIPVSIVTVCYNHSSYLDAYLRSLYESRYPVSEIIIVDNDSGDGSLCILRSHKKVCVLANDHNIGYSAALNQGIEAASSPLVCITGPDVVVEPNWLQFLVEKYLVEPHKTFAVASHVITLDKSEIQSSGSSLHFTGHLNVISLWKPKTWERNTPDIPIEVGGIDSTSALINRSKFLEIGGCDPSFFLYHEEFDYCYRARMRGWSCWYQPESIVFHGKGTAEFSVRSRGEYPRSRPFLHNRNRFICILKDYQRKTIIAILPVLFLVELLNFLILWRMGLHGTYIDAVGWIWNNKRRILAQREHIQVHRRVDDGALLSADPLTFSPVFFREPLFRLSKIILDRILEFYWAVMKLIIY
jgi:GT2 family glycosyltransferase